MSQLPFREQLEKHNNPEEVRLRLAAGQYGHPHAGIAQEYLDSIERKEAAAAAARIEAREEESLATAKDAASSAKAAAAAATSSALSAALATTQARQARNITITFAVISTIVSIIALVLKK